MRAGEEETVVRSKLSEKAEDDVAGGEEESPDEREGNQ